MRFFVCDGKGLKGTINIQGMGSHASAERVSFCMVAAGFGHTQVLAKSAICFRKLTKSAGHKKQKARKYGWSGQFGVFSPNTRNSLDQSRVNSGGRITSRGWPTLSRRRHCHFRTFLGRITRPRTPLRYTRNNAPSLCSPPNAPVTKS